VRRPLRCVLRLRAGKRNWRTDFMKWIALLAVLTVAACENPQLGIGATFSGSGVSVSPTVSGDVGDVKVSVSG
ncbi:MAG: hypothetical protein OXQ92_14395, partial [Boseongicola sp.]|nr:hypothetical protein [Boseongicola sp.]